MGVYVKNSSWTAILYPNRISDYDKVDKGKYGNINVYFPDPFRGNDWGYSSFVF